MEKDREIELVENFLRAEHAKQYTGTDDDMPDAFEDWVGNLEADDWIDLMVDYTHPSPKDWAEVEREFDELFHVRTNSYNEEVGDTGYFKDGMGKQYFKVAEIKSFLRYQLPPCELDEKKIEEIILSVAKEVVQNNVQNTSAAMLGGEQVPQRFLHKEVAQALCLAYKKGEITKEKNEEKQSMDGTKKSENK